MPNHQPGDPVLKDINEKSYTETLISFNSVGDGAWEEKDLSGDGIPADTEIEVLISNNHASQEKQAGIRAVGSSLARLVDIHEAEAGGVTPLTIHVLTDSASKIEIYAETSGDIDFTVVGYRS